MSIFYVLGPSIFRRKMEKTRSMKEEMDGKLFVSGQSRHFSFVNSMIKALFPFCTLTWRANNNVSFQGKGLNRRNESTILLLIFFVALNNTLYLR